MKLCTLREPGGDGPFLMGTQVSHLLFIIDIKECSQSCLLFEFLLSGKARNLDLYVKFLDFKYLSQLKLKKYTGWARNKYNYVIDLYH